MYHFFTDQLRVSRETAIEHRDLLSQTRLLIIQHVVSNTLEYLQHLTAGGAEIFCVFSKPYSIDPVAKAKLDSSYRSVHRSYSDLENSTTIRDVIIEAQQKSDADGKTIVLLDVGGYFCKHVIALGSEHRHIGGIVEDTTFGHNIYQSSLTELKVPVFSVARSALKEIEARFVGRDAVMAMDKLLRDVGVLMSGRRAMVVGYGMIGKNVARSLKAHDLQVSCYDRLDMKNLHAHIDGYKIQKKRDLLNESDIIFSATAEKAISYDDIKQCKHNAILASVGSKDTEFDVAAIKLHAIRHQPLKEGLLDKYELPHSKDIIVAKNGTAVNFMLQGTPTEVLDLVFSEIIVCITRAMNKKGQVGELNTIDDATLSEIAKDWLIGVNIS